MCVGKLENKICIKIEAGCFIDTNSFNTKNCTRQMLKLPSNLEINWINYNLSALDFNHVLILLELF